MPSVLPAAIDEVNQAIPAIQAKIDALTFLSGLPFSSDLETEIAKILAEMLALRDAAIASVAANQALERLGYPAVPTDAVPGSFLAELDAKIQQITQAESIFKALVIGPPVAGTVQWATPHS
jgi:hypothetical protein